VLAKPAQVDRPDLPFAQLPALVGPLVDATDRGGLLLGQPPRLADPPQLGRRHIPSILLYPAHAAENITPAFCTQTPDLDTAIGRLLVCRSRPLAV
jgi:hypothetical protein